MLETPSLENVSLQKVFSLPEERTVRILFCKNLPEAEFLCYRKVTNVDTDSQ